MVPLPEGVFWVLICLLSGPLCLGLGEGHPKELMEEAGAAVRAGTGSTSGSGSWSRVSVTGWNGTGCVSLVSQSPPVMQAQGDVVIGGLFPIHYLAPEWEHSYGSQPLRAACYGFDYRAFRWLMTMVFAVEEVNRDATLLPGVKLGYRILDSCDDVRTSLLGALALISSQGAEGVEEGVEGPRCLAGAPVPAVIGLASSSPTGALAHTLGPFNIPLVSYFATCTCLTDKRVYPSFLRTAPSDLFQVRALVQLVKHLGWSWVGTVGTEDDYSRYGIQAFSKQLEEQGGCPAFHLTLPSSPSPAQLGALADALVISTARVVVVFATEGQLLGFLLELASRNVSGIQWVASEAWVTASVLSSAPFHSLLEGTLGFSFPGVHIPDLRDFLVRVRPSAAPGSEFTNMLWEELFGCRLPFGGERGSTSLRDVGACTGLEDLRDTNTSYTEVSQVRVSYNVYKAVYAIAHALHDMFQCGSPGQGPGSCNLTSTAFTPTQLLHHLKRVNFTNQFGEKVQFDANGEPVPLYDIINWQKDGGGGIRFRKVGSYDGSAPEGQQLLIKESAIVWTGGQNKVPESVCTPPCPPGTRQATQPGKPRCCFDCLPCADGQISNQTGSTECIQCPEYHWSDRDRKSCVAGVDDFLSFSNTMGAILVALTFLGIATTTAITAVFHRHRATPIVRANNSELSFLLLLSLKLCFLCSLVFIGRPSEWACRFRQAVFGISFVLCLSCLLVKTIVVLLAFRATTPGSRALKLFGPVQQRALIFGTTIPQLRLNALVVGLLVTLVQVCLCAGWLALAPPYPFRNPFYLGATGKVVVECKESWPPGFYLVLGYIGLLASLCLLLAFLARKLPDNFNEAKLITFSMLIFCTVWVAFIPAHVSSPGKFTVAVEIFAILASSFGLLLCIFAPKCYIILLRPERNTKKAMTGKPVR